VKIKFSRQTFEKYSNTKFHENPSSGSPVVPSGQKDMTKLIVTFRNFTKALKNVSNFDKFGILKSEPTASSVNKIRFEANRLRRL